MKHRKIFLVILLLAAIGAHFTIVPSMGLGAESVATVAKEKPVAQETSPDKISVGGKSLKQWRTIFGITQKQSDERPDSGTIFSKPAAVPIIKPVVPSSVTPRTPQPAGRQTAQRIIRDAQKTLWTRLAVIANNLTNADTVGYKRNRTLLVGNDTHVAIQGNDWSKQGQLAAAGISANGGGPVLEIQTDFRQGRLKKTGRMLDIAIEGKGFLQVLNQQTGETQYTRAGNLSVNANGDFTVGPAEKGWMIEPGITIPQDATAILVKDNGTVSVKQPGSTCTSQIGQIQMAFFMNPAGLQRLGGKLFAETEASGSAIQANPGQESCGVIRQGHLECSNVDLDEELEDWNTTVERIKTLGRMLPQ